MIFDLTSLYIGFIGLLFGIIFTLSIVRCCLVKRTKNEDNFDMAKFPMQTPEPIFTLSDITPQELAYSNTYPDNLVPVYRPNQYTTQCNY